MAKLIAVFGATGTQGGSITRALLNEPSSFKVRAITRNPNGEKAQAIADLGELIFLHLFVLRRPVCLFRAEIGVKSNIGSFYPPFLLSVT